MAKNLTPEAQEIGKKIAARLQALREISGHSQQQVADAIDSAKESYQSYEHGRALPSIEKLMKLAALYGFDSLDEFLQLETSGKQNVVLTMYSNASKKTKKIVDFILQNPA